MTLLKNPLLQRVLLLVIVYAAMAASVTNFGTTGNAYAILESSAMLGIVAAGLAVNMMAGELDLSVGSVAACAGLVAIMMSGHGLVIAIIAAVVPAVLYGILQGYAIARLQISSLVFTLGTFIGIRGLAYVISDERTLSLALSDLGISMALRERMLLIFSPFSLLMIGVLVLTGLLLRYSRPGREIFAIGGSRKESRAAGVPQTRPLVLSFATSAGLAALAGALASLKGGSATPGSYETVLLAAVTAALIGGVSLYGGRGSMLGVLIGVLTLQVLLSGLQLLGAPNWAANLATGLILLAFLGVDLVNGQSPVADAVRRYSLRARA
ncbi:ABC transporter permease [Salipiger bermudensis]|uniref:Probable sugar ABC transporter, permease protein n=1 Tax=Salipiger bermudensis (strain DSM 26914 / JCM 13377 / KCTC 12554 / HTCC2601) TaxID=314265 RepID=Q0FK51_SALBH|nr:ABC transporter permease [Salipiger bermudensis]EAU44554.1 probable sugar ABC transporter, permease protein [Salipiger bermudensis HTCC2601]MBR9892619.1 ABC transporter permease [bacterium]MCA1284082.1 ABC transporter permease [Salipiger bermudensis]